MRRFVWPLLVFLALVGLLGAGLQRDPRDVPSPLVGRAAPTFELPLLAAAPATPATPATLSSQSLRGQVWVVNVWASWCVACQAEHPVLIDLARQAGVPVIGLNYKDQPAAASAWLARHGNPYRATVQDSAGRVGLDFGVYGVPETYVIDRAGVIRLKHTGPLTPEAVQQRVLPLLRELSQGAG